jgi:short-subunit dehydrogenase
VGDVDETRPFEAQRELDLEVARRVVEVNAQGVITGTKLALDSTPPRGSGHIINIASMAGAASVLGLATFSGTKAAVIAFTDAVRLDHRTSGVEVSQVLPTFTNTELVAGTERPKGFRNAEPEQIAEAIAGLQSHPRLRVYVTRAVVRLLTAQRLMPAFWTESLGRRLGSDQMFPGGVDVQACSAQEERARKS